MILFLLIFMLAWGAAQVGRVVMILFFLTARLSWAALRWGYEALQVRRSRRDAQRTTRRLLAAWEGSEAAERLRARDRARSDEEGTPGV